MNMTFYLSVHPTIAMKLLLLAIALHIVTRGKSQNSIIGQIFSDSVCYDGLGCFGTRAPWRSALRPLPVPESPEEVNTTFYMFPNSDADPIVLRQWPEINFEGIAFNHSCKTTFVVHGFTSQVLDSWPEEMARAIASTECGNVFAVDWSRGADGPNYLAAASNARIAGAEISRVILHLIDVMNVSRTKIHLIGHSLGAHVCAYASNNANGIFSITGLDAAQPLFEEYSDDELFLDKGDACIVVGIHTDSRRFIPSLGLGFIGKVGDSDIYVNGGAHQPGCSYRDILPDDANIIEVLTTALIPREVNSCRHARAHEYYLEAIRNKSCIMWGHEDEAFNQFILALKSGNATDFPETLTGCDVQTCIPLSLNSTEYPARGTFYLKTRNESSYCYFEAVTNRIMATEIRSFTKESARNLCAAKGIQVD